MAAEKTEMENINITFGKTDKLNTFVEHAVVGETGPGLTMGSIRDLHWSKSSVPPQLHVELDVRDKVCRGAKRIGISAEYQARGWTTMRALYAADPKRAKHFADWTKFCDAQAANPDGMRGKIFPDEFLPVALLKMRSAAPSSVSMADAFTFADGTKLDRKPKARAKPKQPDATDPSPPKEAA